MGTTTIICGSNPVLILTSDDLVGVIIFIFLGFVAFGLYKLINKSMGL